MDGHRFDDLTRTLASTRSRRGLLKALTGGLLAGVLGTRAATTEAACPPGTTLCGGRCVNLKTDERNCGVCGRICPSGSTCSLGKCCPTGTTNCAGTCRNLKTDESNCGVCGRVCPPGTYCATGKCCPTGTINCGGVCRNLKTDESNCGLCGRVCLSGSYCSAGKCCNSGFTNCGGTCRNLKTDESNCGACGRVCRSDQTCSAGKCCLTGTTNCGGVCRNLKTDKTNCGTCGHVCPTATCSTTTCSGGVCGLTAITGCCTDAGQCEDDNDCTIDTCTDRTCEHVARVAGTTCTRSGGGSGVCNGTGQCVQCLSGADCESRVCASNVCQPPSCTDGVKNGTETDIDCGSTCPACAIGKACTVGTDCVSGHCCGGTCSTIGASCDTGFFGICAAGTTQCLGNQVVCAQNEQPRPETCNGLDDDCDGLVDEEIPDVGQACNTGWPGICATGTTVCVDGAVDCQQNQQPRIEICNGLDDDCDGVVDNGAAASCPTRANAVSTCAGGVCNFSCNTGFSDCDGNSTNGCECPTPGCCGSTCEVTHDNGVGQAFYDCTSQFTYNATQANKACGAYVAQNGGACSPGSCSGGVQTISATTATTCVVWAHTGGSAGRVFQSAPGVCSCPQSFDAVWY